MQKRAYFFNVWIICAAGDLSLACDDMDSANQIATAHLKQYKHKTVKFFYDWNEYQIEVKRIKDSKPHYPVRNVSPHRGNGNYLWDAEDFKDDVWKVKNRKEV
jgi:hypothetical protein